jgi:AcrR family transcriptional regulator
VPKRVDRSARRREIVDAYLRIVSRSGIAAATSRALAAELGAATGALWHYFDGFDDVRRAAFEQVVEATNARISRSAGERRGLAALEGMTSDIVPHDPQTRNEAAVAVSFWGLLPAHPEFRAQVRAVEEHWGRLVSGYLREAVDDGELTPGTPIAPLTDTVLIVFDALQLRDVQGSEVASPARARGLISALLAPWRTASV